MNPSPFESVSNRQQDQNNGVPKVKRSAKLKSALVAVGGSLVATPVSAIELGDVKVHSTLGQPLRASIAYALAPNEMISDTCVSLVGGPAASGMPNVGSASMIVADGVIAITGKSVVREPLVSMRLNVRCSYTAHITREYMLFIDPADAAPRMFTETSPAPAETPVITQRSTPTPRPTAGQQSFDRDPIAISTRYRVQPGDSLSEIVQRIENRPVALWTAVSAIFAANPDAFIDEDINKLKAGSWLDIPDFGAGEPVTIAEAQTAPATPAAPVSAGTAYEPLQFEAATTPAEKPVSQTPILEEALAGETLAPPQESASPLAELRPGDVIDDSIVIPDTVVDTPESTSSQPNVPVAIVREPRTEATTTNWFLWLIGGGIAMIIGLLLFGRFRDRFTSTPVGAPAAQPKRRRGDADAERIEAIGEIDVEIDDDEPTAENLALDADLVLGTGLQDGSAVDMTEEFTFASTTELDLELPEEISSGAVAPADTDIIPPLNVDESSILKSEVLPEEDDYDMSVIVDATQMPDPGEVTERDLEAIAVPDEDEALASGDYTVSQEVDYSMLEQDYEDELTATQRLNEEIQKAAEELALRMEDTPEDDPKEMSLATVHELDVTAQLRGRNDDELGDDEDTGINPTVELEADDKTAEMPAAEAEADDNTVEMPSKDSQAG